MVDKLLGMVITIWKDSNILQGFSNTITKGVGEVTRRKGRYQITLKYSKYIITYQQHMGRVEVDGGRVF